METWETNLLAEFEKLGEEEVRRRQMRTEYGPIGSQRHQFVQNWLHSERDAREEERSERALGVASKARSEARRANTIAIIAAIIATASILTTIIIAVLK